MIEVFAAIPENPYDFEAGPPQVAEKFGSVSEIPNDAPANCQTLAHLMLARAGLFMEPHERSREIIVSAENPHDKRLETVHGGFECYMPSDVVFLWRARNGPSDLFSAHAVPVLEADTDPIVLQTDFRMPRPVAMPLSRLLEHPRYSGITTTVRPVLIGALQ